MTRATRESGIEWVGRVPSHWAVAPLGSLIRHVKRKNIGGDEQNLLSLSYGRIRRRDIKGNEGLLPESFDGYTVVKRGDIVFRFTDLQNDQKSLRSALATEGGIVTSAYVSVRPRTTVAPTYLNYLMRAYDQSKVFYRMGAGLRQSLTFDEVRRLPVLTPPLPEQRAIATYLDRETADIDALVAEQERLIATLRERRAAVVEHALSAIDGPRRPLRAFTSFHNGDRGKAYPSRDDFVPAGRPFVNAGHLSEGSVSAAEMNYITEDRASLLGGARLRQGDSLFCLRGSVGKRAYVDESWLLNGLLASSLVAVRPSRHAVDPRFLFILLGSGTTTRGITEVATSTAQPNLGGEQLAEFRYPLPPLAEQQRIADYLDEKTAELDALIAECERFISVVKERRAALITAAVTGQIDCTHLIDEHEGAST